MQKITLRYNSTRFEITTNRVEVGAIVKVEEKFYELKNAAAQKLAQRLFMEGAQVLHGNILDFAPL